MQAADAGEGGEECAVGGEGPAVAAVEGGVLAGPGLGIDVDELPIGTAVDGFGTPEVIGGEVGEGHFFKASRFFLGGDFPEEGFGVGLFLLDDGGAFLIHGVGDCAAIADGEEFSIGAEGEGGEVGVAFEFGEDGGGGEVPDVDVGIDAAGGEELAIGGEGGDFEGFFEAGEFGGHFFSGEIPEAEFFADGEELAGGEEEGGGDPAGLVVADFAGVFSGGDVE